MGISLFKGKNIFTITPEEIINILPALSLRNISIIIESDWWIKHKDHPAFADLAKKVIENIKDFESNEESHTKDKAVSFVRYLLNRLETYEGDVTLAQAIKEELEKRIEIPN